MNKKIKVIELLNKIANNEKLPVKIMFNTVVWELMEDEKDYISTHTQERLLKDDNWILRHLNVEVEILEDEEEIDINDLEDLPLNYREVAELCSSESFVDFHNNTRTEINKIIKYLKQLDKKINKED